MYSQILNKVDQNGLEVTLDNVKKLTKKYTNKIMIEDVHLLMV